jgi:hypothetical protein
MAARSAERSMSAVAEGTDVNVPQGLGFPCGRTRRRGLWVRCRA